jgi:hypothetical protein
VHSDVDHEACSSTYAQWPCNEDRPNGTERLYVGGNFPTDGAHGLWLGSGYD